MAKVKLIMLLFAVLNTGLYAQGFNPEIGTAYPFEILEWTFNGEDQLPMMQSLLRTSTITFNPDTTIVVFSNVMYNATFTLLPDGNCEISVRALFVRRNISGTGRLERTARDFSLSVSINAEGEETTTAIRGRISVSPPTTLIPQIPIS